MAPIMILQLQESLL